MQDITSRLSRFIADLRYEQLPEAVVEQVKLFIADYYAACFAGYRINTGLNAPVLELMLEMGGSEESTVLFSDKKLPASNAAFINAAYAHGADMDDGNRKAAGHIGTHVMAAVFALAEARNANWKDVVTAIVAGYEVFNRVAGAAQPSLYNKGFHSTGVGGSLACAAACAKLLNLDEKGIYNAVSLSAIQSSGLIIIDESGQGCKPINPANAARTGVISAQLAQKGLESSRNPLESKTGWFNAFSDGIDVEVLFGQLGETYTICESYLKLYPSCRHTHCCIDGILALREEILADGEQPDGIESIDVTIYPSAIKSAGHTPYPATADEVKFSIQYCIAAALLKGRFGLDELEIVEGYQTVVPKITLIPEPSMEDRKAGIRGARLDVRMASGRTYSQTVLIPKGEAKKPLGWPDIRRKLSQCAGDMCSESVLDHIVEDLRGFAPGESFTILSI